MLNPLNFLSKFIKSNNQRELDKINEIVAKINLLEENVKTLKDTDFPLKTSELKEKIKNGQNKNSAIKSLRPPIFFKRLSKFNSQVEQWNEKEILRIIKKLHLFRVSSLNGDRSSKFQLYFLFLKILN